jgi:hypothetical protein
VPLQVRASGAREVTVEATFDINWIKSTFFRRMIEGGTIPDVTKWLEAFLVKMISVPLSLSLPWTPPSPHALLSFALSLRSPRPQLKLPRSPPLPLFQLNLLLSTKKPSPHLPLPLQLRLLLPPLPLSCSMSSLVSSSSLSSSLATSSFK